MEMLFELLGALFSGSQWKRCNHCGKIAFIAIALPVGFILYMFPVWETNGIVTDESKALCSTTDHPGNVNDAWGNELVYKTYEIEQPLLATKCEVRSAGRDGEYMTDDDITLTSQNIHVTRSVGRAAGEKAKGMVGEFMNALKGNPPVEE